MKLRLFFQRSWMRAILRPFVTKRLRLLPVIGDLRTYHRAALNRDARAGFFIALLALPEGLAFAQIAGLPPKYGVHAMIAGLVIGGLFSGARHVSFGPSLTVAVLLASIFLQLHITAEQRTEALAVLLLLMAFILVIAAWFRIAQLTRYVSRSVTTGFIAAAGFLVVAAQLKHVLGLALPESGVFLQTLRETLLGLAATQWQALLVGGLTAGAYLGLSAKARVLPAAFLAVATGALANWFLTQGGFGSDHLPDLEHALLLGDRGGLEFSWTGMIGSAALALALFTQLEGTLVGRSFAARAGDRFDANQHVFALGLAQAGNAFVGGMPVSASLSRTRIAWRQRPATPLVGVFAGMFCAALFLLVAPWLHHVPRAALAALAIVLATEVVSRHYLRVIVRSTPADAFVLLATIGAALLFRLDIALYVGAGFSILFFLRRVGVPELTEYGFTEQGQLTEVDPKTRTRPDISIVHVEGDLFFGAAEIFFDQARRIVADENLKIIVLRMKNAHHLDATCALAIGDLLRFVQENDRHLVVSGAHKEIFRVFRNSGLLDALGRENFFMHVPSNPTLSTRNALKRAQHLLGGQEANIRIYVDPAKSPAPAPDPGPAAS